MFWGPLLLTLLLFLYDALRLLAPRLRAGDAVRRAREIERLTAQAEKAAGSKGEEFFALLDRLLVEWVEQESGLTLRGAPRKEAVRLLTAKGCAPERAAAWDALASACDAARFAGMSDERGKQELWRRAREWRTGGGR